MNERLWIEELNNKHELYLMYARVIKVYEIDDEYTFIVMF